MVLDPGRRVALEAVADAGDLVVARGVETPAIARIVELGAFESFERVRLPRPHLGHGKGEVLVQDRAEPGFHHHFLPRFTHRLEGANPWIHVRRRDNPVEVVVVIRVGVGRRPSSRRQRSVKLPQKKSLIGIRSGS